MYCIIFYILLYSIDLYLYIINSVFAMFYIKLGINITIPYTRIYLINSVQHFFSLPVSTSFSQFIR